MTEQAEMLGVVAGIVGFISFIPYCISAYRGETEPTPSTWIIWLICGIFTAISYYGVGARSSMWVPMTYVVGPAAVLFLSIRKGMKPFTRLDKFCLSAALVCAIPLMFGLPGPTLIAMIAIDFWGLTPTLRNTYYHPEKESFTGWSLGVVANLLNLFAIGSLDIMKAALPAYLSISCIAMVILMWPPPILRKKSK